MAIIDTELDVNRAMIAGFKDAIVKEIKAVLQKDVDALIENTARDIVARYFVSVTEQNNPITFGKDINLFLLYGDPNKPRRYEVINKAEIVEVK